MGQRVTIKKSAKPEYTYILEWREGKARKRKYQKGTLRSVKSVAQGVERRLAVQLPADGPLTETEWEAVRRARREGIDLGRVLGAWKELCAVREGSVTMAQLCREREAEVQRHRRSSRYGADVRKLFVHVVAAWGERLAADITPQEVEAFVFAGGGQAAATLRKRRAMLHGLFEYALAPSRRWVAVNPVKGLKTPARDEEERKIGILTPGEARDYLQALAEKSPDHLAGEAIALFAGLRRAEVERLQWSEIHLRDEGRSFIEVTKGKSKTRTRRLVDIEPCLEAILRAFPGEGKVWKKNTRRRLDAARVAAGWRGDRTGDLTKPAWVLNCLRHSFVSYHLAHYQDLARTELQAGHDKDMIFEHYRELVTKVQADQFWKIRLAPSPLPPPLAT